MKKFIKFDFGKKIVYIDLDHISLIERTGAALSIYCYGTRTLTLIDKNEIQSFLEAIDTIEETLVTDSDKAKKHIPSDKKI